MATPLHRHVLNIIPSRIKAPLRTAYNRARGSVGRYPYSCPVCRQPVKRFLSVDETLSDLLAQLERQGFDLELFRQSETLNCEQYQCPHCGAADRDRLYALYISKMALPSTTGVRPRLLDIAPSKTLQAFIRHLDRFEYRSADLFMEDVDDRVDLMDMKVYGNGSFDCFICSHVLEHVPDDRRAMRELHRVLKPGGWGIAMAPICLALSETREDPTVTDPAERARRFGQSDHLRLYARNDFIERLQSAGFKVQSLRAADFGSGEFERHGIAARSVLYICRKVAAD